MRLKKLILGLMLVSLICLTLSSVIIAEEQYNEAPEISKMVEEGELPPVEERLPENPKVIDNEYVEGIGEYGGTLKMLENHYPDTFGVMTRILGVGRVLALWNKEVTEMTPNLAEEFSINEEGTELTIKIRKGINWSDGEELTADDYLFYWEDMLSYDPDESLELTDILSDDYIINDEAVKMEKLDDYTIKLIAAGEAPALFNRLLADRGLALTPAPEHYLKQFHPKYNPAEDADEDDLIEQWDDFETIAIYGAQDYTIAALEDPEYPVLTPWKVMAEDDYKPGDQLVVSRNPYYWKVDKDGNQLPYMNGIQSDFVDDEELQLLKFREGEVDFQIFPPEDPVLFQSQDEGDYYILENVSFDLGPQYYTNYNYSDYLREEEDASEGEIEVAKLMENEPDFRRALMLALDNDNLIDTFFPFTGDAYNRWLPPNAPLTDHPDLENTKNEINKLYEKDLEEANRLLDEIGIEKEDDGWRYLEVDGEKHRVKIDGIVPADPRTEPTAMYISDKIKEDLGIDWRVRAMDIGTFHTRLPAGNFQVAMHDGLRVEYNFLPDNRRTRRYPLFETWRNTNGDEGIEPYGKKGDIYEKKVELDKKIKTTVDENRREELIIERIKLTLGNFIDILDPVRPAFMSTVVSNRTKNAPEVLKVGNTTGWPHAFRVDQYYLEK